MRDQYLRQYEAFILVYACDKKASQSNDDIYPIMDQLKNIKDKEIKEIPIVLVGNKVIQIIYRHSVNTKRKLDTIWKQEHFGNIFPQILCFPNDLETIILN